MGKPLLVKKFYHHLMKVKLKEKIESQRCQHQKAENRRHDPHRKCQLQCRPKHHRVRLPPIHQRNVVALLREKKQLLCILSVHSHPAAQHQRQKYQQTRIGLC